MTVAWPTTEIERVLFIADTQVLVTETPANTNTGPKVEEYLKSVGLAKGNPWCAAAVAWCGVKALGAHWPLPLTGSCQQLYEKAKAKNLVRSSPEIGDVFLLWFPKLNRFAHTGFIEKAGPKLYEWTTIEGNTSGAGSREGWGCFRRTRSFNPEDRFVRWSP